MILSRLLKQWEGDDSGRRRYRLAAYSTAANIMSRALNMIVLIVSVPLTISYLGNVRFGIWMTLVSMIGVMGYLDFGIGSSLLNQVAETAATGSAARLRQVVTHGLAALTAIGAGLLMVLTAGIRFIHWSVFLSGNGVAAQASLTRALYTVAFLIALSLPATGLMRVFWGLQRAYVYFLWISAGRILTLGLLVWLSRLHAGISALLLATYGVQLLCTLPLFVILRRRGLCGGINAADFGRDVRHLLRQGVPFFVLSLGAVVAWDSDNIIIAQALGAAAVAIFAIAVRLFQMVELSLQAVNNPLWAAYADAHALGDGGFLRRLLGRSILITFGLAALGVAVLAGWQKIIVAIWLHREVALPESLMVLLAVWFVIRCCGNSFAMYLNAIRMMREQVWIVLAFCLVALPLKLYMTRAFGLQGIVLASVIAYCLCVIVPYATVYRARWQSALARRRPSAGDWPAEAFGA